MCALRSAVLAAGGQGSSTDTLKSAELYNPLTGSWMATGAMTGARAGFQMVLLGGKGEAQPFLMCGEGE